MRPSGRAPDQMRELTFEPGFTRHAEGACLVSFGDTRVLVHRERRGAGPALPSRQGPGLGHGRIWHAPARHPHARQPRGGQGQAIGPNAGNPAADRPLAARGGRPAQARRAADHGRLRRHPGRWRHAHRVHLRRLGRASHRGRQAARQQGLAADPIRTQVAAVSCGIYNGTPVLDLDYDEDSKAGFGRQFRAHRRRLDRRGAVDRRGRDASTRKACCACFAWRASAATRFSRRSSRPTGR